MNIEAYQANLHYRVLAIAMALHVHKHESGLLQVVNTALDQMDWGTLRRLQAAFDAMSGKERRTIELGVGHPLRIAGAIASLELRYRLGEAWREMTQSRAGVSPKLLH